MHVYKIYTLPLICITMDKAQAERIDKQTDVV